MSERTEENAKPNKVSQTASPAKRSFRTAITTSSSLSSSASSAASSPISSPKAGAGEDDETLSKAAHNDEEEEENEEEEEEESEEMQDLRNKFRDTLRLVRTYKEEQEQWRATLEDQKRFSELMLKTHAKEIALKDVEIAELKKRLVQVKEESDRFRVKTQKEMANLEAPYRAEEERLKAELRTANAATNKSSANSSKSFSMKSFSTIFQSGKSQKMQQKMHADADVAERDQARMVAGLKKDLDAAKITLKRLHAQVEEYSDCSAQSAMEIKRLSDHCELLETKLREGKVKFKKMQVAVQNSKQALCDMTLKAGWVAEQYQQSSEDLQYERSKHIKQSRLQQVKQGEELQRVKQELAELKKARAGGAAATATVVSVVAKADGGKKAISVAAPAAPAAAAAAPVEEVVLLGTETIAELVALKAKQREQRDVKTDQVLQKNKEKARKDKANQVAGEGDVIGQMMQRVRGCGADSDEDEEDDDQEWF